MQRGHCRQTYKVHTCMKYACDRRELSASSRHYAGPVTGCASLQQQAASSAACVYAAAVTGWPSQPVFGAVNLYVVMLCKHYKEQQQPQRCGRSSCGSSSGSSAMHLPVQPLAAKLADWRSRICAAQAVAHISTPTALHAPLSHSIRSGHHKAVRRHPTMSAAAAPAAVVVAAAASAAAAATTGTGAVLSAGDVVEVSCERLGTGGVGVCLWGPTQLVLLVKGALPGEQLTAVITAVKKNYAEGAKLSTQHPHTDAVAPACQHYGTCGGCSLQALNYPAQLAHKTNYVGQIISRVGQLAQADVAVAQQPPVAAAAVYGYRNKVQMAFSSLVWQPQAQQQHQQQHQQGLSEGQGAVQQGFGLGYFLPGSNSVVLPIQECSLASAEMNQVVSQVRQLCQHHGLQPHNAPDGTGVLRHLIIRSAAAAAAATIATPQAAGPAPPAGQPAAAAAAAAGAAATAGAGAAGAERKLMAMLVTSAAVNSQPQAEQALTLVAQQLMDTCPSLASVVHSVEAPPCPAAAAAAVGRTDSKQGNSRRGRQPSSGRSPGSRGGDSGSDNDSNGSRGAQPLRVQSSRVLAGAGSLVEHMCGLQFQVSPHSFFQTNTAQAERLYQLAVQAAAEAIGTGSSSSHAASAGDAAEDDQQQHQQQLGTAPDVVNVPARAAAVGGAPGVILDLYCGTGTIALCLAAALPAQQVVGFEVSASSIADAKANAARNGLANVSFVRGDLNQLLPEGFSGAKQHGQGGGKQKGRAGSKQSGREIKQQAAPGQQEGQLQQLQQLRPQVVVVDPARAGLGAGVVQYLVQCGAQRIVYVSCNAATQARDLQLLCGEGAFKLSSWRCVDLFPQTDVAHVETVVVLDRAGGLQG